RPGEAAQDSDRRVVQADADTDTRRAEPPQGERQRDELGHVGVLAVAPLVREPTTLTQMLDQLARKPLAGFGFRGPLNDVVIEYPVEQRPVFVDAQLCGHVVTAVRLRLTSSRRNLPDEVRGSEPGRTNTTLAGTMPHSDATLATNSPRAPASSGARNSSLITSPGRLVSAPVPAPTTAPSRTPRISAATRSISAGKTLRIGRASCRE